MGRTRIELTTSGDIDMYDDIAAPLTFAVADIRKPDKRNASFSKTIKVPATKENNIRFGHIFDVNLSETTYDPNIKAPCTLYIDDVPQLKGFLQILSIEIDDKGRMEYSVSIQGNVGNIFGDLGDSYLNDLDLSDLDHTLNRATQEAAWDYDYNDGYCYPLIDYGYNSSANQYKVEHLIPSVFVRTYIDKMFSNLGYTYTSNFFDSERFRNLLIPCNPQEFKMLQSDEQDRLFEANLSVLTNASYAFNLNTPSLWETLRFDTDVNDPANAFNTTTNAWTVQEAGYYDITGGWILNTTGSISYNGGVTYTNNTNTRIGIRKYDGTNYTIISDIYVIITQTPGTYAVSASNVFLNVGDVIDTCLTDGFSSFLGTMNIQQGTSFSYFKNSVANNGVLQAGDSIVMNNIIPKKIKQKDFLLDIIRMFGLYVEVDVSNEKHLLIDTRDDFYASGSTMDWTYKLDNSKPLEVKPMGDLQFKDFKFSYKEDKDYFNKKSEDAYGIVYGNRDYLTANEFLKTTNETSVMFSPTPLVAPTGDDRVIPHIYEIDSNNIVKSKPINIRILYRGGRKTTSTPYDWVDSSATSGTISYSEYLYAGHLDSVTAPTFDLSFSPPKELYYDTNVYTDGNVFNEYHKKNIEEITDKDSKIVIGYFYLTLKDIAQLDFRDTYYFENQNWRLNRIYDYNPVFSEVTKCEFIRIKEGVSFSPSTGSVGDSIQPDGMVFGGDSEPSPTTVDIGNPRNTLIYGEGNTVGSGLRNSIINGHSNNVSGGDGIVLLNSSGCTVYDGLENVTLINTSGTIVTESNVVYVNGYEITGDTFKGLSATWTTPTFNASDYEAQGGGTWTVGSGDVITNSYNVIGKTIYWNVVLSTTTTSSTPSSLIVYLPTGTISHTFSQRATVQVGATYYSNVIVVGLATGDSVEIKQDDGSAFDDGTNTVELAFSITFELE